MPFLHWKCHFCTENAIFSPKKIFFLKKKIMGCSTDFWRARRGDSENEIFFFAFSMKRQENPKSNLENFFPKKRRFSLKLTFFSLKMPFFSLKMPFFHQKVPFFHWICHFFTEKCHFLTENAIFSPKMSFFHLKRLFFHQKSAIFSLKMPFFHLEMPFIHLEIANRSTLPLGGGVAPTGGADEATSEVPCASARHV